MSDGYLAWHMQELVRADMQKLRHDPTVRFGLGSSLDSLDSENTDVIFDNAIQRLRDATPYTWNTPMARVLMERALQPPAPPSIENLPSPTGFAWFESPIHDVHGWLWMPLHVRGNTRCGVLAIARGRHPKTRATYWMTRDFVAYGEHWKWDDMAPDEFDLAHYFAASIHLLNERITYTTRPVPRSMLSKKQRKWTADQAYEPIVRVVELRTIARELEGDVPQDDGPMRELHCQFAVREHGRKIRNRETGEARVVKVRAHIKGPAGAPWKAPRATVFHVDR